ncbi:perilipin family protein [Stigmatella erecta]|uniref:Late embryogenesis abundant protein n=1 Tax=Stigmatella erecta TaxID=83460 RepID=A0A1I0A1V8_9BACT|nr:perilipin family protein [Stigmatella erecta]SES88017.1 hypothetical protein SAMN05443639_101516 [Stigmatella erecta]
MGLGGIVSGAANAAKRAAESAAKAAADAARKAAEAAQQAAQKAAESAQKSVAEAGQKVSSAAQAQAKDVFEGAKNAVGGVADKAQNLANRAVDTVQKAAGGAVNKAQDVATQAVDKVQDLAHNTVDKAQDVAHKTVDKVQDLASDAASKVPGPVGQVLNKAQNVVSGAVDKVQGAANGAVNKVQDIATGAVDKAQGAVSGVVDQAQDAASSAVDRVQDLGNGTVDKVQELAGSAIGKFQDTAQALGRAADFAVKNPGQVLDKATDIAADGLNRMGEALQNAPTANPLQKMANQVTGGLLQTGADLVRDPVETARAAQDALTLSSEVDSLKEGESAKVSLSGEGNVALVSAKAKGELEVKRNKEADGGGYTVSVNGEVGAGVAAKLGAKGAADAGASAYGTAGAKVEFKFATAEEAKQATDLISRAAVTAGAGVANPLAGVAANQVLGDPLSEVASLKDNVSAMEFKLGAEGSLTGSVGASGLGDVVGVGAKASLNGKTDATARVEFKDGHPAKVALKQSVELSGQVGASAGLDIPGSNGSSASLPGGASAEGKAGLKVELEQSFNLPKDFDPASLVTDPSGAARQIQATAQDSQQVKLTATDSRQGSLKGLGFNGSAGQEVKIEMTAKAADLARSGAVDRLLEGDIGQAVTQAGSAVQTKTTLQEKVTEGNNLSVGLHAGAGGGEVGLSTERTHLGDTRELSPEQLAQHYLQGGWVNEAFS